MWLSETAATDSGSLAASSEALYLCTVSCGRGEYTLDKQKTGKKFDNLSEFVPTTLGVDCACTART